MSYIEVVRHSQKPTQGDTRFVPGERGAQRNTGHVNRQAKQE